MVSSNLIESSALAKAIAASLRSYFRLDDRKTSILGEFRAGAATFLTMSYILLVNPQLLSKIGIPATDIVVSTAIASALGSIITGLLGNLPFGLGPGAYKLMFIYLVVQLLHCHP